MGLSAFRITCRHADVQTGLAIQEKGKSTDQADCHDYRQQNIALVTGLRGD
jgi:hypothetical protein